MHRELTKKHHLRHYARLQYAAFLKGAGVKVEDAVQFFKREFSKGNPKKVTEYTYYVEHLYGLKGKKTSFSPWGCNKMINQNSPSKKMHYNKIQEKYTDALMLIMEKLI